MGSGEEDFKGFDHIWTWRPSWSCDQDHIYKIYVPSSQEGSTYNLALIGHVVCRKKMFENNGQIHVYSPWAGAGNLLGSIVFQKCIYFVILDICCKCFSFNYFVTVFPHSHAQATKFDLGVEIKVNQGSPFIQSL